MKKLISLFLLAAMMLSLFPLSAMAEGVEPTVTLQTAEALPGEDVTLALTLSGNPGMTIIRIPFSFDEEKLTLVSINKGESCLPQAFYINEQGRTIVWSTATNSDANGTMLTFTFHVKENAAAGFAAVELGKIDSNNESQQLISYSAVSGGITVKATEEPPEPEEPSNITASSVDFNGKMYLNTYINLSEEVMSDADAYISTTFNGVTTNHSVAELIRNLDGQGRVKVRQELFAAMMRDEMTLQVFNGANEAQPLTYKKTADVTDGFVYTALEYLKGRQQNSSNPAMVELARAAELYGIAAQVKFDYNLDQLTAEDIAAMEAAAEAITIPASCAETLSGTLPAGVAQRTKTVLFESDNSLRQYFYINDAEIGNYTFTLNGETVNPVKKEAGKYNVDQPNIASGLLSTEYTFTISDGTDTYTIRSSALGYAYDRQERSTDQNMINLSKLLYRYSQAADAYFSLSK